MTSGRRSRISELTPAGRGWTVGAACSIELGNNCGSIGAPTRRRNRLMSWARAVRCRATLASAPRRTSSAWRRSVRGAMPPSSRARVSVTLRPALDAVSSAIASRLASAPKVSQASAVSATRASRVALAAASLAK